MKEQVLYIYMDDSGVLHSNEPCCVYGGIAFLSEEEKNKFTNKYQEYIQKIKHYYCKYNVNNCKQESPEIKDTNIHYQHKKKILKYLENEFCFAVIIDNKKVSPEIMKQKTARGRFRDYTERILLKRILTYFIKEKLLNPNEPVKLVLRIDEQINILHLERDLLEDIQKEFTKGMSNFKYFMYFPPILHSDLNIDLKYVDSKSDYGVQASDIIAGETRKFYKKNQLDKLQFLKLKIFLP